MATEIPFETANVEIFPQFVPEPKIDCVVAASREDTHETLFIAQETIERDVKLILITATTNGELIKHELMFRSLEVSRQEVLQTIIKP